MLLAHLPASPIGSLDESAEHGSEVLGGDVDELPGFVDVAVAA